MTAGKRSPPTKWIKHLVGAGVTLICLLILLKQVNLVDILQAFSRFNWIYLIPGVGILACGYALRIFRWSMMLRAAGANVDFVRCSAPFLGSIALNNILPLRLGDVVRALVFPKSMGVAKTTATSSLIVERLIDLMTLLASFAIGIFAIQAVGISSEIKASAVSLALAGGAVLSAGLLFSKELSRFFANYSLGMGRDARLSKISAILSELLGSFNAMSRPKLLVSMLVVSMLIWFCEAGLFYFVLVGTGIKSSLVIAMLVMSVATLSTLVPSSPGYVGPFHIAAYTAISLVGGTAAQAGSYAVIVHLALWLSTTLAGTIAIWLCPEIFRGIKSHSA